MKLRHFHVYFQSSEGHVKKTKYRSYKHENIVEALALVKEGNTIYKAAKMTGVPRQTLSDRVLGHVSAEQQHSGPDKLFSMQEETKLVDHIITTARYGYGYTRLGLRKMATDTALYL